VLKDLYVFYMDTDNADSFEAELAGIEMVGSAADDPLDRRVADLIASMTDRHALDLYSRLFFPLPLV
jgi:dGTPase